jgi:hypothetical protein
VTHIASCHRCGHRSWLAGHEIKNIAAARKTTATELYESLIDVCGYDRLTARKVLRDGTRRPARRKPADLDPAGDAEGARVQRVVNDVLLDHSPAVAAVLDAARALNAKAKQTGSAFFQTPWHETTQLHRALATLDGIDPGVAVQPALEPRPELPTSTPEPLERWSAHRCPTCRWIGPFIDHDDHAGCPGELQPVALLVMPREVPCPT